MRLTQLFVNRPPLVFVLVAVVALAGCFALATLVQQNTPNIDFPIVSVSVVVSRRSAVGAARLGRAADRRCDRRCAQHRSHQYVDPAEPGDDQHVLHARFEPNDRSHRSPGSRANGARRVALGSSGADGAHVRSRAGDDHDALGYLAIAEHCRSLGDRHQHDRSGTRTSARRFERHRQRHGHARARGQGRSAEALELRLHRQRRGERDPIEQRARAGRNRLCTEPGNDDRRSRRHANGRPNRRTCC